ncbi:MAG: nucleoid occlusion factor SlmA [Halopseudomonas sp.]
MTQASDKLSRREQILQSLAHLLEANSGARITTAGLAREVGVSEAALYRHFPSKAKMFEGLIGFIEETLFSRVKMITQSDGNSLKQCEQILTLLLAFVERNPGMARIMTGEALSGESDRLRQQISQLFDRLELQLKQILREAELKEGLRTQATPTISANLLIACAEGRIRQFVRSEFKQPPTQGWDDQWPLLAQPLFR